MLKNAKRTRASKNKERSTYISFAGGSPATQKGITGPRSGKGRRGTCPKRQKGRGNHYHGKKEGRIPNLPPRREDRVQFWERKKLIKRTTTPSPKGMNQGGKGLQRLKKRKGVIKTFSAAKGGTSRSQETKRKITQAERRRRVKK